MICTLHFLFFRLICSGWWADCKVDSDCHRDANRIVQRPAQSIEPGVPYCGGKYDHQIGHTTHYRGPVFSDHITKHNQQGDYCRYQKQMQQVGRMVTPVQQDKQCARRESSMVGCIAITAAMQANAGSPGRNWYSSRQIKIANAVLRLRIPTCNCGILRIGLPPFNLSNSFQCDPIPFLKDRCGFLSSGQRNLYE